MDLTIPSTRVLFSQMQEPLRQVHWTQVTLTDGIYIISENSHWIVKYVTANMTLIQELILLTPIITGNQDSLRTIFRGVYLLGKQTKTLAP